MTAAAPRRDYTGEPLSEDNLRATPYEQASLWLDEALAAAGTRADVPEPTAMALATVDADGRPDVRTVLMRFFDPDGFGFVTHLDSAKGRQIAAAPVAAATLTWPSLYRAIRVRGPVAQLPEATVRAYYVTRPWGSRISAWASEQSAPIGARTDLEGRYALLAARYPDTGSPQDVPMPPRWGGFRILPDEVEFWSGRPDRLHDRIAFTRTGPGTLADAEAWTTVRRQP